MIRNSNSGSKDNVINQKNTFIFILFRKKDDNYHLLAPNVLEISLFLPHSKQLTLIYRFTILYENNSYHPGRNVGKAMLVRQRY